MIKDQVVPEEELSGILKLPLSSYTRFIYERISDIILILTADGKVMSLSPSFERQFGYTQADLPGLTIEKLVQKEELLTLSTTIEKLTNSPGETVPFDLHLYAKDGELRDLTGRISSLTEIPEIQGILIIGTDTTEQRRWEAILGQYSHRLEVLRKIQTGILQAESPDKISKAALDHINSIIPCAMASITLFEAGKNDIHLLASIGGASPTNTTSDKPEQIEEIQAVLRQGEWFEVDDIKAWRDRSPLFFMMELMGLKRLFFIPMLIRGTLIGSLNLAFPGDVVARLDHLEAAREIADMLALSIQQSKLLESEHRQRQQAELIRDAISSIATSLDFHRVMEDLLTNLHLLVNYDNARIVLIEEDGLKVAAANGFPDDAHVSGKKYSKNNLIFQEMLTTRRPFIISDTKIERRFKQWESGENIRAWMGVPLISHNGMIGYLSLNSSLPGAFDQIDPVPILVVADHVAVTLENAWLYDETARRAKELSAISRVSTSLRKAVNLNELLDTLINKTTEAVSASCGLIYRIENGEVILSAGTGPARQSIGSSSPIRDNPLLDALGESRSIILGADLDLPKLKRWLDQKPCQGKSKNSAFIPLTTADGLVGVMVLNLGDTSELEPERRKLLESIADMASNALYRVMTMGELENRVAAQTRDLTVLFEVSSITSQALELKEMTALSLDRLLSFTTNSLGVVYLLDTTASQLRRLAECRLPASQRKKANEEEGSPESTPLPEEISLSETNFFHEPLNSGFLHVVQDLTIENQTPMCFARPDLVGYAGIPIKNKGRMLGMLCLFSGDQMKISIEQMTLLSAIGDQLGVAIESNRLRQRAAEAAVFEERQRLARDLHDSVTQSLYSLTLLAEGYRRQVPQGSPSDIQAWLEDLESVSLQALKEMRLLLYELKPASFQEDGLMNALNSRLQSVETRSGMKVNFNVDSQAVIPVKYHENLYRIAQEALNNIIKHSGANFVQITLGRLDGGIILEIQDNGKGFQPLKEINAGGLGLRGMNERANNMGGKLEIESEVDSGTKVRVVIPGGLS